MRGYICFPTMESDWGDLGDIILASGCGDASTTSSHPAIAPNWQSAPETPNVRPPEEGRPNGGFGSVPFSDLGDPLLHELSGTTFFDSADPLAGLVGKSVAGDDGGGAATVGGGCGDSGRMIQQNFHGVGETKGPCDIFSRVLQLSPGLKDSSTVPPKGIKPAGPVLSGGIVKVDACRRLDEGRLDNSSPRAAGVKRRKNQAKKVVCIPAPAAASSKPGGGEVVPSDLWAWRKYGQKPIKGSPYPRGYYRCSSSKGCSARKQVERSGTDPNMLVITYTYEHNHPWPIQRSALAGSTKALLPLKSSSSAPRSSPLSSNPQATEKEEPRESLSTAGASSRVKEEVPETTMTTTGVSRDHELDGHALHRSGEPTLPETSQSDDFFADLGELESNPMSLVFSKEFLGDQPDEDAGRDPMDPFSCFG